MSWLEPNGASCAPFSASVACHEISAFPYADAEFALPRPISVFAVRPSGPAKGKLNSASTPLSQYAGNCTALVHASATTNASARRLWMKSVIQRSASAFPLAEPV